MTKSLILFLFVAISWQAQAQNVNPQSDTIRWNASGFVDQNNGKNLQGSSQFITYGINKIDWVQKNGKLVYTLIVSNVTGTWVDSGAEGSLTYNVTLNDMIGTLSIVRSAGVLSLSLNLTGTVDKINNLYTIANFDIL